MVRRLRVRKQKQPELVAFVIYGDAGIRIAVSEKSLYNHGP